MSLPRALSAAASDFYRQSWRLVVLNALLGALLVAVALAGLAARPALVLFVFLGPFACALMHCSVTIAETGDLRFSEALVGLRRYWRRGLALASVTAATILIGLVAVRFYGSLGTWSWPLAALTLYLVLAFLVVQLALWPLAVAERERAFGQVVGDAARLVAGRPGGFLGLGMALLVVNAIGVAAALLPFLTLTIAFSFLAAAHFALPAHSLREA
jgi:hypothetical protein